MQKDFSLYGCLSIFIGSDFIINIYISRVDINVSFISLMLYHECSLIKSRVIYKLSVNPEMEHESCRN